ncbi:MAG: hypothetical protein EBV03_06390 [Proteobacteria bacterium]|nr:hypothetical protein [Pseudomonadota bacterium]
MHIEVKKLKPLSSVSLTPDEEKMLRWLRAAPWEKLPDIREPTLRAKVPEFFSGVRLYQMQAGGAGGAQGLLGLFIKKLEYQGVLSKQDMHPVAAQGNARYLALKQTDLDNLGVGQHDDDE